MKEKCKLEANGLRLIELHSCAKPMDGIDGDELDEVIRETFAGRSYAVIWLDYKVLIGIWEDKAFHFYQDEQFDTKFIQRLRVFNQQREFHVWRSNGRLKGRLRTDDLSGTGNMAVVAHQVLFGTTANSLNAHFTEISEQRGTRLILPFSNVKVDDKESRVFIKTHNYVSFNPIHQATYSDCRFVAFTDSQKVFS